MQSLYQNKVQGEIVSVTNTTITHRLHYYLHQHNHLHHHLHQHNHLHHRYIIVNS
jgi:hypothetical protein